MAGTEQELRKNDVVVPLHPMENMAGLDVADDVVGDVAFRRSRTYVRKLMPHKTHAITDLNGPLRPETGTPIAMMNVKYGVLIAAVMLVALMVSPQSALAQHCEQETFEEARYIVCTLEPRKADLRLFWRNAQGKPYRDFSSVAEAVEKERRTLTFAMNAGMYSADFSPMGLYVENGRELRPASTAGGEGSTGPLPNFYKKPNGVFFLDDVRAGILPTDKFLKLRPKVRFATQSGPMLVIQNKLHPALIPGSTDRTRRSGVGVCDGGAVRFAISEDRVNFHDFARLFRDRLKCPNALFLDGGRGVGIYNPTMGRNGRSWHGGFGPIFGLVE